MHALYTSRTAVHQSRQLVATDHKSCAVKCRVPTETDAAFKCRLPKVCACTRAVVTKKTKWLRQAQYDKGKLLNEILFFYNHGKGNNEVWENNRNCSHLKQNEAKNVIVLQTLL